MHAPNQLNDFAALLLLLLLLIPACRSSPTEAEVPNEVLVRIAFDGLASQSCCCCCCCCCCNVSYWCRSSPKDAEVLSEVLVRIAAHHLCTKSRKPFTEQSEWLATVKRDPAAAAALLGRHLGLGAGSSSSSGSSSQRSVAVQRVVKRIGRSEWHSKVGPL
jgi:hypothetical protein